MRFIIFKNVTSPPIHITATKNQIKKMDIKSKILEILKQEGEPLNAGKITELGDLERKEVDKAMKAMKEDGSIVSPKRCYWEPAK